MPFAGTVPLSALLLLLVLSAEAQPVEGFMPTGNATAMEAAEMCTVFHGGLVDKAPVAVFLDDAVLLPWASGAAPSPAPWRAPSPPPPPIVTDTRPTTPGAAPAHKKGLSWRAKTWVTAVAMLIVVFLSRPEACPVSRIDGNGADTPLDGNGGGEFFYCAICMETVADILKFSVSSCGHEFCFSCVAQYVAAKLGDNSARVDCPHPGCGGAGAVEPESCRGIISPDLLDKWGFLLCESALGAGKVYCPYRECSAPLLADDGREAIAQAECPHCHRLFCARCAVPWHAGVECREFQQLGQDERGRDDLLLRRLAGRQRWQRCPKCHMYVEKSEGCKCNYIKCRCGYSFCYRCASMVSALTHYCNKCKR
ncbi:hypothetical protein QYE76_053895 [Lolium multiflorum]|uniref:RBR-type E3 ubiquitin transferase n=1 Tax=Lolium multiflorum TaxID=4521 RepID=A0AAD8SY64_LOLMU|nr:hypothetical protein QYE76_053895 [Lolium multiflorum]